jgi:N-methylhydantoinase B
VDPVLYQIIQSRLSGIVQEMQDNVFRTGYSTILRESHDGSCMILDADANVVGEHLIAPVHVTCLTEFVRAVRATFGDDIHPGDAFLTNHPYLGGIMHSMDIGILTPVFSARRPGAPPELVAFCGSIAHKSDMGGVNPGTHNAAARELFQEGVQFPPVRLVSRGTYERDIEEILRANSRTPSVVLGDVHGQVGVARLGERRLADTFAHYGLDAVLEVFAQKLVITERRVRREIAAWPDGVHEGEAFVDSDGVQLDRRIRYHVRIEKTGDRILFDFTGCDDQAQGPINILPHLARGCIYYALISTIDLTLPNDGGLARAVETKFRRGSIVDPIFPAPCSTYMATTTAVLEATLQALGGFLPDRRHAGNSGTGGITISGLRTDGSRFVQYEPVASAYGGSARGDGLSGISILLANMMVTPVEIIESEYPTRLERFELIRDSGGPGTARGGLSPRRVYRILAPSAQLTLRGGRHVLPSAGRFGGRPGRLGRCLVETPDGTVRELPSRFSGERLEPGDMVTIERAGAGGFGDPQARRFEQVVDDVANGYVSREAAIAEYGVDAARLDAALGYLSSPGLVTARNS